MSHRDNRINGGTPGRGLASQVAPPRVAPSPPPPSPPRWEYRTADTPPDGAALNDLGASGWEAVGIVSARCDGFTVLLKRPLPC